MKAKPEITPIKLKFKNMSSFEFASMVQKLASAQTSNKNACAIARVVRELEKAQKLISDTYQEKIVTQFAKKDEAGKVIRPENDPVGYEPLEMEKFDEKLAEALEKFGEENEFEVNSRPLTPSILADVKISAKEINLLGELFAEDEVVQAGPGVPHLQSM